MQGIFYVFLFTTFLCAESLSRDLTHTKYYKDHFKNKINNLQNKWIDKNKFNSQPRSFDDFTAYVIIRFKNRQIIPQIKTMCEENINVYLQQQQKLGEECYLGDKCQYIFEKTIIGLYGKFQMSNLREIIEQCFEEKDIDFIELDSKVSKFQGYKQQVSPQKRQQFLGSSSTIYISPQSESYDSVNTQISCLEKQKSSGAFYVPNFKSEQLDKVGNQTVQLLSQNIFAQIEFDNIYNFNSNDQDQEQGQEFAKQQQNNNVNSYEQSSINKNRLVNSFENEYSIQMYQYNNQNNISYTFDEEYDSINQIIIDEPLISAFSLDDGNQDQIQFFSPKGIKSQQVQSGLWNLDRIDQTSLPLDGRFNFGGEKYIGTGRGVTIYVLDSGIRATHSEFQDLSQSRSRARVGVDFVDNDGHGADCDGHGTHIASTAVGRAVGVAKEAEVVGVRVLDCVGDGRVGNVVKALEWVAGDRKGPAVVMLSLGVESGAWSLGLEQAVENLIQVHNITVTVASGNMETDSCQISPANVASTLTVGASNLQNKFDSIQYFGVAENIYKYGNTGACVDIFAPGVDIFGACGGENKCGFVHDEAYAWDDGTSMAVPHVAGAVAVILGEFPDATPREIKEILIRTSTLNKITQSQLLPNTPNRLLHINITEMAEQYALIKSTI